MLAAADEIAAVDEFRFDTRKPEPGGGGSGSCLGAGSENEDQLSEPARPKRRQQ